MLIFPFNCSELSASKMICINTGSIKLTQHSDKYAIVILNYNTGTRKRRKNYVLCCFCCDELQPNSTYVHQGYSINTVLIIQLPRCQLTNLARCGYYSDVIMSSIASQITSLAIVYSSVYSGANQRKRQSSASLAFVWWIHRSPVNSPHKGPVMRKMFPFDDVIMNKLIAAIQITDRWAKRFLNPHPRISARRVVAINELNKKHIR